MGNFLSGNLAWTMLIPEEIRMKVVGTHLRKHRVAEERGMGRHS